MGYGYSGIRFWNSRTSHCLSFISCSGSSCVRDSKTCWSLLQQVTQSDERPIELSKVCSLWLQILERILLISQGWKSFIVWKPGLISVGYTGMKWGDGLWVSETMDWNQFLLVWSDRVIYAMCWIVAMWWNLVSDRMSPAGWETEEEFFVFRES